MGNCKCQNEKDLEFQDKKQLILTPHPPKQQQTSLLNLIPKPISHEPAPNFAKQIDTFPQLSNQIISVDQNLGQFKPTQTHEWKQGQEPVYINKTYQLHNGLIYQGQWNKGAMNGTGVFYLQDGSFVRGFCLDNEMVGEARFIRENGNYYQGQIRGDKANGQGVMYENGVQFKGYFHDNYLQGKGTQISPNYQFQGNYHRGARIDGRLVWDLQKPEPTVYEGSFFDEQFNGEGKLTNQIGEYVGTFDNGKKKGKGVFTWKNGERFEGMYDSDLKNGEGRMFNNKNVVVLQGTWQNDRFKN